MNWLAGGQIRRPRHFPVCLQNLGTGYPKSTARLTQSRKLFAEVDISSPTTPKSVLTKSFLRCFKCYTRSLISFKSCRVWTQPVRGEWLSHLHNAKRERCILVRGGDVGRETERLAHITATWTKNKKQRKNASRRAETWQMSFKIHATLLLPTHFLDVSRRVHSKQLSPFNLSRSQSTGVAKLVELQPWSGVQASNQARQLKKPQICRSINFLADLPLLWCLRQMKFIKSHEPNALDLLL